MPDPDITSTNCDGETSTAQLGHNLASLTPNLRLAIVKHDHRTLVNDDTLTAPDNGGDLPGGLKVNLCSEDAEQPNAARITTSNPSTAGGVPVASGGTATVPVPVGTNVANAIRMQLDAAGDDCGLVVSPPKFTAVGSVARTSIVDNEAPGSGSPTLDGPKIATVAITNPDTVRRLFRLKGRFSLIVELDQNNGAPEPINLLQLIYASKLNDDPVNYVPAGTQRFVGGGDENTRVVTITHPEGNFGGFTVNDQREFVDEVIVDAGATCYVHYFTKTIRSRNFLVAGSTVPQRGVNIVGVSVEECYAVGGA